MRSLRLVAWMVVAVGAGASASCFNPVHQDEVAALGGEANGERPGEDHRPGQPCLVCHGGAGPGPDFAIAGTVYRTRARGTGGKDDALPGVTVVLTDADKTEWRSRETNRVGNFYITANDWSPTYPVRVRLELGKTTSKEMVSLIGRNGGCASCHYSADNQPSHMPPVFLFDK